MSSHCLYPSATTNTVTPIVPIVSTEKKDNIEFLKWIPWIILALIVALAIWAIYYYSEKQKQATQTSRDLALAHTIATNRQAVAPIVQKTVVTPTPVVVPAPNPVILTPPINPLSFSPEYYCYQSFMDDWFKTLKPWKKIDNGEYYTKDCNGNTFRRDTSGRFYLKDSYGNWWIKGTGDYWWLKDRDGSIVKKTLDGGKMWKLDPYGEIWYRDNTNNTWQRRSNDPQNANMNMQGDLAKERDFYSTWGKRNDPYFNQNIIESTQNDQCGGNQNNVSVYGNYFSLSTPFQLQDDTGIGSLFQDVQPPKSVSSGILNKGDSMCDYSVTKAVGNRMSFL